MILNKATDRIPDGAVYVGRPTAWGNPFVVRVPHPTRAEAVELFRQWVWKPERMGLRNLARKLLKGKDLVCWCAPKPCHAEIWRDIAKSPEESRS